MSEHDRFQIILERPKDKLVADENYLDIRRTGDAVFVEITQLRGRTTEVKRALYRQIAERLSTNAGIRKEDILTSVTENDAADWCSEWAKHNPRNKRTVELGVGNSGSVADGC